MTPDPQTPDVGEPSLGERAQRCLAFVDGVAADYKRDPVKWHVVGGPGKAQREALETAAVLALVSIAESLEALVARKCGEGDAGL